MKSKPKRTGGGGGDPFEFCDVCKLNHDQGRRHKYFPSHVRSLSSHLSRFHKKIAALRSLLNNPGISQPEHSHLDGIWCVFCGVYVRDNGSSFTCGDVIYHLASSEHLTNLKDFLRKHGGGMDRVDSFRVSDDEVIMWERRCRSLKSAASTLSEGAIRQLPASSKDIQHELTKKKKENSDVLSISSFNSNAYHAVMPLQNLTNEGNRLYPQELNETIQDGSVPYSAAALSVGLQGNIGLQGISAMGSFSVSLTGKQPMQLANSGKTVPGHSLTGGMESRNGYGGDCSRVLQKFTQISSAAKGSQANVHTGALPPWLDANEKEISQPNTGPHLNELATSSTQTGKSRKLNPKRVGAAWADRRRVELEMEKRGERVPNSFEANWLPNFGRVWQAGTRRESKKEFEVEKRKFVEDNNQLDLPFKAQPYISKRMRTGSPNRDNAVVGRV